MSTATFSNKQHAYVPPLRERIRVAWQNWKVRKTGRALRVLKKAMRDDPDFARTWHANIAMPIYDATRPQCWCHVIRNGLCSACLARSANENIFKCRDMPAEQANYIADKLMEHLFDV